MIATVTLNPAIDKSVTVRSFEIGKTNGGEVERVDAGGKGIKVSNLAAAQELIPQVILEEVDG